MSAGLLVGRPRGLDTLVLNRAASPHTGIGDCGGRQAPVLKNMQGLPPSGFLVRVMISMWAHVSTVPFPLSAVLSCPLRLPLFSVVSWLVTEVESLPSQACTLGGTLHCSSCCVCWETRRPFAGWNSSLSQSVLFSVRQTYGICGLMLAVGCACHRVTISICCPSPFKPAS